MLRKLFSVLHLRKENDAALTNPGLTRPQSPIMCSEHGPSRPAFVCAHLVLTLRDGQPRGAVWSRDESGCVNGYCDACDARLATAGGEWTRDLEKQADIQLVCEDCFQRILLLNGQPYERANGT
jgi:hypothetical protein